MRNTKLILVMVLLVQCIAGNKSIAQAPLPPALEWHGKSENLIYPKNNTWITPSELSNFTTTPSYNETMDWLSKLCSTSVFLHVVTIGRSPEGRAIKMIVASTEKSILASDLKKSTKPLLLVQAGIHAGEIDGKDAGMMLVRDIALGKKKELIDKVNFLFIPILSVDAHERNSAYHRPNQRGPESMGWRTNSQNLNLNRDYTKLDTKELRAVIAVINEYNPLLYMDIHVTDGADYQYDITFGAQYPGYSPAISSWLLKKYTPYLNQKLQAEDHIPGPLMNAYNGSDFKDGNIFYSGGPRFSNEYANLRHLGALLVENHSLKPYKQRVLGTYVLLENTLRLLAENGDALRDSSRKDAALRNSTIPLSWTLPYTSTEENSKHKNDSSTLLTVETKKHHSTITNSDYVEFTGKKTSTTCAQYAMNSGENYVKRPKAYWIPAACEEVIERLKLHGIKYELLTETKEVNVDMYRISEYTFGNDEKKVLPFEGRMQVIAKTKTEKQKRIFPQGSAYVSTDQPLGDLAIVLLEPGSKDSFFSWGFFHSIFQRTEYIESYVMEPYAKKMLEESPELQKEFELKLKEDAAFAKDPYAILTWFYSKTKYYDTNYLLYPVGREM